MSSIDDVVSRLRQVLSRLDDLDFFPPWDAVSTIVGIVGEVVEIATQAPEPEPDHVDTCAAAWRSIQGHLSTAHTDLGKVAPAAPASVWDGDDAAGFRKTLTGFAGRVDTAEGAADSVATALVTLSTDMTAARKRHDEAYGKVLDAVSLDWDDFIPSIDLNPLNGLDAPWPTGKFVEVVQGLIATVRELLGSYEDAAEALRTAARDITTALDGIDLPDHLPTSGGISAIDAINAWDDDKGPLRGSVLERYDEMFAGLSDAEKAAVRQALEGADTDLERGWILAGVASGLGSGDLDAYLGHLGTMTPQQIEAMDPSLFRGGRSGQPDDTTCGSSTLVMARMVNDPAYAMWMVTGVDPRGDLPAGGSSEADQNDRFEQQSQAMHDKTNGWTQNGQPQVPWPGAWGTTPGAVVNEMNHGQSGVPGADYEMQYVDPYDRAESFDRIVRASEDGHAVPIFVGDDSTPAPRHVVLVTGSTADSITVFDPYAGRDGSGNAVGQTVTLSRSDWESGNFDIAGWDEPWGAVLPQ